MKTLITLLFSVSCLTTASQNFRNAKDQTYIWGENYLVRNFYLKVETESGVKDSHGNPVKTFYEPAKVEMKSNLNVELTKETNWLYSINKRDVYIELVSEPRYNSGILHNTGDKNIRFYEIKKTKYNPRYCEPGVPDPDGSNIDRGI